MGVIKCRSCGKRRTLFEKHTCKIKFSAKEAARLRRIRAKRRRRK